MRFTDPFANPAGGRRRLAGRSYAATVRALRAQIEQFFVAADGAGVPAARPTSAPASFVVS